MVSGVFGGGDDNGYFGNMMQRKRIVLNRPDLENETIYWAVQTIDTGLAKSAWSVEQVFEITQACTENWVYGEWSSCVSGQQTRMATDLNNCGTTVNKSATVQSCSSPPSGSGSSYIPPEHDDNGTNTTEDGTGSPDEDTLNASGNASSGTNLGRELNGSNQTLRVCAPFELECDGDNLMECAADGMEWVLKEVCEFGCINGTCVEGEEADIDYYLLGAAGVVIGVVAVGIYFMKTRKQLR